MPAKKRKPQHSNRRSSRVKGGQITQETLRRIARGSSVSKRAVLPNAVAVSAVKAAKAHEKDRGQKVDRRIIKWLKEENIERLAKKMFDEGFICMEDVVAMDDSDIRCCQITEAEDVKSLKAALASAKSYLEKTIHLQQATNALHEIALLFHPNYGKGTGAATGAAASAAAGARNKKCLTLVEADQMVLDRARLVNPGLADFLERNMHARENQNHHYDDDDYF